MNCSTVLGRRVGRVLHDRRRCEALIVRPKEYLDGALPPPTRSLSMPSCGPTPSRMTSGCAGPPSAPSLRLRALLTRHPGALADLVASLPMLTGRQEIVITGTGPTSGPRYAASGYPEPSWPGAIRTGHRCSTDGPKEQPTYAAAFPATPRRTTRPHSARNSRAYPDDRGRQRQARKRRPAHRRRLAYRGQLAYRRHPGHRRHPAHRRHHGRRRRPDAYNAMDADTDPGPGSTPAPLARRSPRSPPTRPACFGARPAAARRSRPRVGRHCTSWSWPRPARTPRWWTWRPAPSCAFGCRGPRTTSPTSRPSTWSRSLWPMIPSVTTWHSPRRRPAPTCPGTSGPCAAANCASSSDVWWPPRTGRSWAFPGPPPLLGVSRFRPSVALIEPTAEPQLIRRQADGSTWVRFGWDRDDVWLPVEDRHAARPRCGPTRATQRQETRNRARIQPAVPVGDGQPTPGRPLLQGVRRRPTPRLRNPAGGPRRPSLSARVCLRRDPRPWPTRR